MIFFHFTLLSDPNSDGMIGSGVAFKSQLIHLPTSGMILN